MTDRVQCGNVKCEKMILPATAERTGGLCMPCVNAAASMEREAFIRENRRDVDEFAGVTDPVEVLKIVHRRREYDPLINWIPHPSPTDQLYFGLTDSEQYRLAKHAITLIPTDRREDAEEIFLCLAAFTDADLDESLRALVACDDFRESLPFHRAPVDVRDELIGRVETDEENRNQMLLALAWIGDSVVVEKFDQWRHAPPQWQESLYIPANEYSYYAGWELSDDGRRRDLFYPTCTKLVRGPSASPATFKAIAEREDACPWCRAKLTNLLNIDPSCFGILCGTLRYRPVEVVTCEVCTCFATVFGCYDDQGRGMWSPVNSRPEYLPDDADDWERLSADSLTPASKRPTFSAASMSLPTSFSKIGGHPAWVQDAYYPKCPKCSTTMMFLAQVDNEDIEDYSEGTFYVHVCPSCRITGTHYQQT